MDHFPTSTPWTLILAGLFFLWLMIRGAWRGFQRGPLRQCAGPFSLTSGLLLGWFYGREFGFWILEETSFPWLLRGFVGSLFLGCVSGLFLYGIIWWLGKKSPQSEEAESPVLGAMVGCWTGMLYFSILFLLTVTLAAVIELWEPTQKAETNWIVSLRNDLAETPYTAWIKKWSPLPERTQRLIQGMRSIAQSPEARAKLMKNPKMTEISRHPTLKAAIEDEYIFKLLNDNNLSAFISHPKIHAVLADENLQRKVAQLEIEALIIESTKPAKVQFE